MASSISRRLCRTLLYTNPKLKPSNFSYSFCSKTLSSPETSESDEPTALHSVNSDTDAESPGPLSSSSNSTTQQRAVQNRPLENGLDVGIYKGILVGQVGQAPIQKKLRNGRMVTMLSLGTGGIRNNRRPFDNEEPREYANRSAIQWHRVSIFPERLGELAVKNFVPGSILYVEGNLETKIFNDPITGLVRRVREIAIRRNGRLVFLGQGNDNKKPSQGNLKGVGYY